MPFLTNPTGQCLLQHKTTSGKTVDYTIKDSTNATILSGTLTEISTSGLYYKYVDLSSYSNQVFMVYFNIDSRQAEDFQQIWKGVVVDG